MEVNLNILQVIKNRANFGRWKNMLTQGVSKFRFLPKICYSEALMNSLNTSRQFNKIWWANDWRSSHSDYFYKCGRGGTEDTLERKVVGPQTGYSLTAPAWN